MTPDPALRERIQGRLDRLGLSAEQASQAARLGPERLPQILAGRMPLPRGKALRDLAEALGCTLSYLVGLEPDEPPPEELLQEEQGTLGALLAGDQEALLRAYGRLDLSGKAALLLVAQRMAGPEPVAETKPVGRPRAASPRKPKAGADSARRKG